MTKKAILPLICLGALLSACGQSEPPTPVSEAQQAAENTLQNDATEQDATAAIADSNDTQAMSGESIDEPVDELESASAQDMSEDGGTAADNADDLTVDSRDESGQLAAAADNELVEVEAAAKAAPLAESDYVVAAGDTLIKIARENGTTVQAIVDANGLSDPDKLFVGQKLVIE